MIIKAVCKFCKKPLELHADDEYFANGDKFEMMRLVPMACCNTCADYRVHRRNIVATIVKLCQQVIFRSRSKQTPEADDKVKEAMRELLKRYLRMMADHRREPVPNWDEAILDHVMRQPEKIGNTLFMMGTLFAQKELRI